MSFSAWSLLTLRIAALIDFCSGTGSTCARTLRVMKYTGLCSFETYTPALRSSAMPCTFSSRTTPTISQAISGPSPVLPGMIS